MTSLAGTQRYGACLWLLIILVTCYGGATQFKGFDSSILALLPESDQMPYVQQAADQLAGQFSKQVLMLVRGPSDKAVRKGVADLAGRLQGLEVVGEVRWKIEGSELQRDQADAFRHRFFLLDDATRALVREGAFDQVRQRALGQLFGPFSVGASDLVQDPFGLSSSWQAHRKVPVSFEIDRDLLRVSDSGQFAYLMVVTLAADPFLPRVQGEVLGAVASAEAEWADSGIQVLQSGMLQHAAAGTQQAKLEMSTIGGLSLTGILLMLWWVFRTWIPMFLVILAVAVGCLMALATSFLIFGRVHVITLTFGAGLVGVAVDYALHSVCASYGRQATDKSILPALFLGLFSSVMAYSAQAMAPFPGLRQMAVFSVVGLTAAWLTVVLWFPIWCSALPQRELHSAQALARLRMKFPRIEANRIGLVCLLVLLGLAGFSLTENTNQDDIRLLQTSPPVLLQKESEVQQLLGLGSSSQFLMVHAASLQACLEQEEQLREDLDVMRESGLLGQYLALSQVLPSLSRQMENKQWVDALYAEQLQPLYQTLQLSSDMFQQANVILRQANQPFTEADLFQGLHQQDWQRLVVQHADGSVSTLIRLVGGMDSTSQDKLKALVQSQEGVMYVNQVEDMSDLMTRYREQVVAWVGGAYLVVLLVLMVRFKREVWRVVLPPFLASIYTLAILVQLEQGLNIFHWLALILVLGIGLDMGIFLQEVGEAPHTWLAVCLSAGTSLMAFGLLSFSQTPILHHFGLTVLLGLTGVLLLAPLMRKMEFESRG